MEEQYLTKPLGFYYFFPTYTDKLRSNYLSTFYFIVIGHFPSNIKDFKKKRKFNKCVISLSNKTLLLLWSYIEN